MLHASNRISEPVTRDDLEETLRHAAGRYGWSFDDPDTTIGSLYQMLHGRDFLDHYGAKYVWLSRTEKDYFNREFWERNHNHMGTLN